MKKLFLFIALIMPAISIAMDNDDCGDEFLRENEYNLFNDQFYILADNGLEIDNNIHEIINADSQINPISAQHNINNQPEQTALAKLAPSISSVSSENIPQDTQQTLNNSRPKKRQKINENKEVVIEDHNSQTGNANLANQDNNVQKITLESLQKRQHMIKCTDHNHVASTLGSLKRSFTNTHTDTQMIKEYENKLIGDLKPFCPLCNKIYKFANCYTLSDVKNLLQTHYSHEHIQLNVSDFDKSPQKYFRLMEQKNFHLKKLDTRSTNASNYESWDTIKRRMHTITCSQGDKVSSTQFSTLKKTYKNKHIHSADDESKIKEYENNFTRDLQAICPKCLENKKKISPLNYFTLNDIKEVLQRHYKNIHKENTPADLWDKPEQYIRRLPKIYSAEEKRLEEIKKRKHTVTCSEQHVLSFAKFNDLKKEFKTNHCHNDSDKNLIDNYYNNLKNDLQPFCPECADSYGNQCYYTVIDLWSNIYYHFYNTHNKKRVPIDFSDNIQDYMRIKVENATDTTTTTTTTTKTN